jgi:nucleoside-diphosphate-sugar epimerase
LWITSHHLGGKLLVTGAGGRIGRLLRHAWSGGEPPVWQSRRAAGASGLAWDFGPALPDGWPSRAVILHLAGVTGGSADDLATNVTLAYALARAARQSGALHVLFASTVAVYRPTLAPIGEAVPPDPPSDYGRSKRAAERTLAQGLAGSGIGLTCLRIGNIAGADALMGGASVRNGAEVVLDPVPGQPMGPERSYIGPLTLARVLADLIQLAPDLPDVLNLAQPGPVAMGDLLQASGLAWRFGPERAGVVPRVHVATDRLEGLVAIAPASAAGLISELEKLRGVWP